MSLEALSWYIPRILSVQEDDPAPRKSRCQDCCQGPVRKLGEFLRGAYYLSRYSKTLSPADIADQKLAEKSAAVAKREWGAKFDIQEVKVEFQGTVTRTFTLLVFDSKGSVEGRRLRLVFFSWYGHSQTEVGVTGRWEPLTISELGDRPLRIIQAWQSVNVHVDSLMTVSLGNVAMQGLKHFSLQDREVVPLTMIINRGLTSVQKVSSKLYPRPVSTVLHAAARLTEWDADPEKALVDFLEREPDATKKERQVVVVETPHDYYFSKEGAFGDNLHHKINALGVPVFRGSFYGFGYHERAHHALPLDHLEHNDETQVHIDTIPLNMQNEQTLATTVVEKIFFKNANFHTCFIVGGSDETQEIGMLREVVPLLSAFLQSSQKASREEKSA